MRYLKVGFVVTACLFVLACASPVKVSPIAPQPYPPTTSCEVFIEAAPDRAYVEIALIEVDAGTKHIETARKKAMSLGADAIILQESVKVPVGDIAGYPRFNRTIYLAVKWKD
jgi:hypothetical protein